MLYVRKDVPANLISAENASLEDSMAVKLFLQSTQKHDRKASLWPEGVFRFIFYKL